MCEKQPQSKTQSGLSDEICTLPNGWDLSALLKPDSAPETEHTESPDQGQHSASADQEAKMRADWQLDPHLDHQDDPSRRDLSAY